MKRALVRTCLAVLTPLCLTTVFARTLELPAGQPLPNLQPGDTLLLLPGVHPGPWEIGTPAVMLLGLPGATLSGGGTGVALTVRADDVQLRSLEIVDVGANPDLYAPDAAVAILNANRVTVDGLQALDVTAGVWIENAADVTLRALNLRGTSTGPGVTAYQTPNLQVEGGRIEGFLDGVYIERANGASVRALSLHDHTRYGLHVMFSVNVTLEANTVSGGGVGSAVMYGRGSRVLGNTFAGHVGAMAFGLLLQEEQNTQVAGNHLERNSVGALLIAASGTELSENTFERNGAAVLFDRTPIGSSADPSRVALAGNRFQANAADVAVADPDAALALSGNHFDRATPLDLNRDGVLDLPHLPTSGFAAAAAQIPDLMLFAYGPGIELWRRLEAAVPGLRQATFADREPWAAAAAVPLRSFDPRVAVLTLGLLLASVGLARPPRRLAP
jgi:nitrous oxidase accessory protein